MKHDFQDTVRRATGAEAIVHLDDIQSLWSGYGMVMRYGIQAGTCESVLVKHVKLPGKADPPRGWSPGHWKINSYSERLAREVLSGLNEAVSRACD